MARVPVGDHPQRIRPGVIREEFLAAAGVDGGDEQATAPDAAPTSVPRCWLPCWGCAAGVRRAAG